MSARTFTQKDVNSIIARARHEDRAELEALAKQLEDHRTVAEAGKARVAELEAELTRVREELKASEGASAELASDLEAERARVNELKSSAVEARKEAEHADKRAKQAQDRAQREFDRAKLQIDELNDKHTKLVGELRAQVTRDAVLGALREVRVLNKAEPTAEKLFRADLELELDDKHQISKVTYAGKEVKTVSEAAAEFIRSHDYLQSAGVVAPGGGTRPPSTGGKPEAGFEKMSPVELVSAGLRGSTL